MTIYQMNDGRFVIKGEGWSDRTMHIIKNAHRSASLVVTRGRVPNGRTFDEELVSEYARLASQIAYFNQTEPVSVTLPHLPGCPAREISATYRHHGIVCHQRQVAVLLPGKRIVIVTYAMQRAFGLEDEIFWQRVKATLDLD